MTMDRRTFVKTVGAGGALALVPCIAVAQLHSSERVLLSASDVPEALRGAAIVYTFSESGVHEVTAALRTPPRTSTPGHIELVRQEGSVLDAVAVPTGDEGLSWVQTRSRFERGERIGLRLPTSYRMEIEDFEVQRVPDLASAEPYGVWVRDSDRPRAARRAREIATQLDRTLYLGRDLYTGEYLALSGAADRVPFRDEHYGEAPIVPRGDYWEKTLVAEGRAPWL